MTLEDKLGTGWRKTIPGMGRKGLYELFAEMGFKVGAEVGLFRGRNARQMFKSIPGLKLFGIDPFDDQPSSTRHKNVPRYDRNRRVSAERLRHWDVEIIEEFSEIAVQKIPYNSLDFVYIDGDHSYDYAMLDIILWSRRVRPGGVIAGHDYTTLKDYTHTFDVNVKEAVDDYTKIHKIYNWYLTDPTVSPNKSDKCPSWFFIKKETYD